MKSKNSLNDAEKEIKTANESKFIKIGNNNLTNVPKYSQNSEKLKELEDKMNDIESNLSQVKEKLQSNKTTRQENKKEILQIYKETKSINDNFTDSLSNKIKNAFIKDFDMASREVIKQEKEMIKMKDRAYEYQNLIYELDTNYEKLNEEKFKLEELYADVKNEYEYLKESYDDMVKENSELRKENEMKNERINNLENDLNDMKNVIGKLTEVRVTLNKYFSSHFENFTPNEKKVIQEIKGAIDENFYKQHMNDNFQNKMKESVEGSKYKSDKKVLNEEEYKSYQNNLNSSKPFGKNDFNMSKNKSVLGRDNSFEDEFWYKNKSDKFS